MKEIDLSAIDWDAEFPLIKDQVVAKALGWHVETLWNRRAQGTAPAVIDMGSRQKGTRPCDVRDYVSDRRVDKAAS